MILSMFRVALVYTLTMQARLRRPPLCELHTPTPSLTRIRPVPNRNLLPLRVGPICDYQILNAEFTLYFIRTDHSYSARSAGQLASLPRLISLFREEEPGHKATGQPGETKKPRYEATGQLGETKEPRYEAIGQPGETSKESGYEATGQPKKPGHDEGTGQPGETNIQVRPVIVTVVSKCSYIS